MVACNAGTENVASWQVIDYIPVLSTCSPAQLWSLHSLILQFYNSLLGLLTNFIFQSSLGALSQTWLMNKQLCGEFKVHYLDIINIFDRKEFYEVVTYMYSAWKSMWPYGRFLFSTHPLGIPVPGGGGGFMKISLLFWMEKTLFYTSILEQFNMYRKY